MGVAANIKRLRKDAKLTQEQLAEKLGVARSTITQWENGWTQPRMGMVQALATVFGTTASVIVADESASGVVQTKTATESLVPLVSWERHAGGTSDQQTTTRYIEVPASVIANHPRAQGLIVEGDCMNRIAPDGIAVVFDPDLNPENGAITIIEANHEVIIRRWYLSGSTLVLVADSTHDFNDIIFRKGEGPIRVIGTVVWIQSPEELL
ncbi:MAG: helix-turn-helix domain-containing protein [Atopobiaceae bacterium]|nr:helix-turn-helix domain-containing protein [Atopobiaceae bacterium]